MKRGLADFLGYFVVALITLVLLPLGIILMILFTIVDGLARFTRRLFS